MLQRLPLPRFGARADRPGKLRIPEYLTVRRLRKWPAREGRPSRYRRYERYNVNRAVLNAALDAVTGRRTTRTSVIYTRFTLGHGEPRFNATINTIPDIAGRVTAEPSREFTYRTEYRLTTRGLLCPCKPSPDPPVYNHAAVPRVLGKGRDAGVCRVSVAYARW